ncbi:MAG: hypothetical protein AB7G75_05845 [Candidatus Binatia bacterium]
MKTSTMKAFVIAATLAGAVTGLSIRSPALAGGTGGHALLWDWELSADTQRVTTVFLEVTAGWLNAPHAVSVTITSVNGDPLDVFFHGTTEADLADLNVVEGSISQGSAVVELPFNDIRDREFHTTYTFCSHVIFADQTPGPEVCSTPPFQF